MAQLVSTVDDLDGKSEAQTVSFALDGQEYEVDLSDKNHKALSDALSKYIAVARPKRAVRSSAGKATRGRSKAKAGTSNAEIREWANSNGYEVGDRGRIPETIREAYAAAN